MFIELRNKVYDYIVSDRPTVRDAVAFSSTCRKARAEYLPLYLQRATVDLPFYFVQRFLKTYFPTNTGENTSDAVCIICIDITGECPRADPEIDMQWLIGFLLDHPSIEVHFRASMTASSEEARDIARLLRIAKANPVCRTRLANFESVKLLTYTRWRPGAVDKYGDFVLRPIWILKFKLKPGYVEVWCRNKTERHAHTWQMLIDMGMRRAWEGDECSAFMFLRIEVSKMRRHWFYSDKSRPSDDCY